MLTESFCCTFCGEDEMDLMVSLPFFFACSTHKRATKPPAYYCCFLTFTVNNSHYMIGFILVKNNTIPEILVLSDFPYKFLKFITITSAATLCCVLHQWCVATPVSIIKRYYSTADDKQSKHDIKKLNQSYAINERRLKLI